MEKKTEFNIWYWVLAFLAVIFIHNYVVGTRNVVPISYSQFETYLQEDRINNVANLVARSRTLLPLLLLTMLPWRTLSLLL